MGIPESTISFPLHEMEKAAVFVAELARQYVRFSASVENGYLFINILGV